MREQLGSDALVVAVDLLGEDGQVMFVGKACNCAYCQQRVQMVNGRFRNLEDGDLHTCPNEMIRRNAEASGTTYLRRYARGEFELSTRSERDGE